MIDGPPLAGPSDGGAPSSCQRGQLFTEVFGGKLKSAVVTTVLSNPIKRGIATAIFWINPLFRAVPPSQVFEALRHLDLDGELPGLLTELERLQASLPRVAALESVAEIARAPKPAR